MEDKSIIFKIFYAYQHDMEFDYILKIGAFKKMIEEDKKDFVAMLRRVADNIEENY